MELPTVLANHNNYRKGLFSEEELAIAAEMAGRNCGVVEISLALGRCHGTVRYNLTKIGVLLPQRSHFWTQERVCVAVEKALEGLKMADVADHVGSGCNRNMVIGLLNRMAGRGEFERKSDVDKEPETTLNDRLRFDEVVLVRGCVYVLGDPRSTTWKWCGAKPIEFGAPYCAEHFALCNMIKRDGN